MIEHTPSQAEGERDDDTAPDSPETRPDYDPPWTTPSQAEGERDDEAEEQRPLAAAPDQETRARDEEAPSES